MGNSMLQYQRNLHYLTEDQCDISDLPFVRNKSYNRKQSANMGNDIIMGSSLSYNEKQ